MFVIENNLASEHAQLKLCGLLSEVGFKQVTAGDKASNKSADNELVFTFPSKGTTEKVLTICLVSHPTEWLAGELFHDKNQVADDLLACWQQSVKSCFERVQQQSGYVMLSATDVLTNPSGFVDYLISQLKLEPSINADNSVKAPAILELDATSNDLVNAHELYQDLILKIDLISPLEVVCENDQYRTELFEDALSNLPSLAELTALRACAQHQSQHDENLQTIAELNDVVKHKVQCVDEVKAEHSIAHHQITQLQEELETIYQANKQLEKDHNYTHQKNDEIEQTKSQLVEEVSALASENELALLQIHQLQEELETTYIKNDKTQKFKESSDSNLAKELAKVNEQLGNYEAENELALLQIHQLQEELENYYLKWLTQKELSKNIASSEAFLKANLSQSYRAAICNTFKLQEVYEEPHYQHIEVALGGLSLIDGRHFESFNCKLVNNSGIYSLEFRDSKLPADTFSQWPESCNDEYGCFMLFTPSPTSELKAAQEKVRYGMNTSDRLLMLSVAHCIVSQLAVLANSSDSPYDTAKLREFKHISINLLAQIESMGHWLTFDNVDLKEEHREDDYEHLWLEFKNLMFGAQFFPRFQCKVMASGLSPNNTIKAFANSIAFEFREQGGGVHPLQSWPQNGKDDYGVFAQAFIDMKANHFSVSGIADPTPNDSAFIAQLSSNLESIFLKLSYSGDKELNRSWSDWLFVAELIKNKYLSGLKKSLPAKVKGKLRRMLKA